jgi:hypothetical protein
MTNETETSDIEVNETHLTCEYDPRHDEYDPLFVFDSLIDVEQPEVTRCRCDDSPTEFLTCHNCGFVECEYYGYRYKSSAYCNKCAFEVCGKLIEKPKFAFTQLRIDVEEEPEEEPEFFNCESCSNETKWEDKINYVDENGPWFCPKCAHESDLRAPYSMDQCIALTMYAEKHNITFEEAIDYQSHCHSCGNEVKDGVFDEDNHQYCRKRCQEHCEDYWYECYRGEECKVCEISAYHARRDSLTAYDIELSDLEPVLATIDCFKELQVYSQLYECLEDLAEYFDSDRQWRYGL